MCLVFISNWREMMLLSLPKDVLQVFENYITCEYASFTASGQPITVPVTPYIGANGTLDTSTGLVYPAKAERARKNPHVALLFSDPTGSGLSDPPVVLVQGKAAVRDADLQANTDRYLRASQGKLPALMAGFPKWLVRMQAWYWVRIWLEVTPARVLWWDHGDTDAPPNEWIAPEGMIYPPSDAPPKGTKPPAWREPPSDWRPSAAYAVQSLGLPVVTVNNGNTPAAVRAKAITLAQDGFILTLPKCPPALMQGSACLTFHKHPERFTTMKNMMFVGDLHGDGVGAHFKVERRIADWSAGGGTGNRLAGMISFLRTGIQLTPRLKQEVARRDQPMPKIRI